MTTLTQQHTNVINHMAKLEANAVKLLGAHLWSVDILFLRGLEGDQITCDLSRWGYIQMVGWNQYALTEKGKALIPIKPELKIGDIVETPRGRGKFIGTTPLGNCIVLVSEKRGKRIDTVDMLFSKDEIKAIKE